jgi:hypothetical protein
MITTIKTPEQIKIAQQNYIKESEDRAVESLITQFNEQIIYTMPNKDGSYTLYLYIARPAGVTDISNVEKRFIIHCVTAGWRVKKLSDISDCQLIITVIPSLHL